MGRKTYEQAKDMMKHREGRLRVILTSRPEDYNKQTIPGQLEFSSESPRQIVQRLSERGYTQALLLGGSSTNSAFLKENLIDELWLTIEPIIFGGGTPLFAESDAKKNWELLSVATLNSQGTLLLKYQIKPTKF
jgi:dihydrofolate reductase